MSLTITLTVVCFVLLNALFSFRTQVPLSLLCQFSIQLLIPCLPLPCPLTVLSFQIHATYIHTCLTVNRSFSSYQSPDRLTGKKDHIHTLRRWSYKITTTKHLGLRDMLLYHLSHPKSRDWNGGLPHWSTSTYCLLDFLLCHSWSPVCCCLCTLPVLGLCLWPPPSCLSIVNLSRHCHLPTLLALPWMKVNCLNLYAVSESCIFLSHATFYFVRLWTKLNCSFCSRRLYSCWPCFKKCSIVIRSFFQTLLFYVPAFAVKLQPMMD